MGDERRAVGRRGFGLRDVSGTTVALTSLAILGAAAVVTTPLWLWYRRKRKRTDALARQSGGTATRSEQSPPTDTAMPQPADSKGNARGPEDP